MPRRIIPNKRNTGYPVKIDWTNPLTKGLEHLYISLNGGMFDLIDNEFISNPSSSSVLAPTSYGVMEDYDGVNLGYDAIEQKDRRTFTLGMVAIADTHSAGTCMIGLGYSADTTPIVYTFSTTTASSSTLTNRCRNEGSSTSDTVSASVTEGDVFTHTIVRDDTTHKIKLNDDAIVTGETGSTGVMTIDRIAFGGLQRTGPAVQADGKMGFSWLYDRAISDAELDELHRNPRQLLKPITQHIDVFIPAAGGATGKSNPLSGPLGGPLAGAIA